MTFSGTWTLCHTETLQSLSPVHDSNGGKTLKQTGNAENLGLFLREVGTRGKR